METGSVGNKSAVITGQEAKHLRTVLRLGPGDLVELVDGRGTIARAQIETITHNRATFTILDNLSPGSESWLHVTIAQGMLKDKKMDMLIRHLTELGICQWLPFFSSRSIPKPDATRLSSRRERWDKIAKEALKQCGRTMLPIINSPVQMEELLEATQAYDKKIAFWENATVPLAASNESTLKPIEKIIVLIGPEGGFSTAEMDAAKARGFISCSLGPRILRAETASLAAATLVQYVFGDLGQNSP
jgi:16S rRNA (uracil1498-N3)-methyltransferase